LAPVRRRRTDQIAIVDGTLIPVRGHRLAAQSKNYRYSANLQVAIEPTPAWSSPWARLSRVTATTRSRTATPASPLSSPVGP